jgi:hypothetical protein
MVPMEHRNVVSRRLQFFSLCFEGGETVFAAMGWTLKFLFQKKNHLIMVNQFLFQQQ